MRQTPSGIIFFQLLNAIFILLNKTSLTLHFFSSEFYFVYIFSAAIIYKLQLELKNHTVQEDPCGLYYKGFMSIINDRNDSTIVIYNHNDSGLKYKSFTIVNYASEEHNLGS
jgi:hypothetical protein